MEFNIDDGSPGRKTRAREGLHLRPLNVEKGAKRFSSRAPDSFPPQGAAWRNNLAALSQRRNLLFVAYTHQIYVWEPAGSFQTLGAKPEMIITPVMKDPYSSGYISPHMPHAINNILVDDLGRDEVLLLVTDSGNVCGYRVEAIFSALKRAAERKEHRPFDGSQVLPFFVEYVEASAWGLAIHKFSRLIAVTANTGLVTVFAFALVNHASRKGSDTGQVLSEEEEFTDYGQTWLEIKSDEQFKQLQHLMPAKHRNQNIRLTYTGHFTNIPSVSFLNCDLDPNGTWMVSTDIENQVFVWKTWEGPGPFNVYHFGDASFRYPETFNHDKERGWSVIALDPRTFHLLKSTKDACGGHPQRRVENGRPVLDLTKLSSRVPNASRLYNYFPPAVKAEPEQPILPDIFGPDCCINKDTSTRQSTSHAVYDGLSAECRRADEAPEPSDTQDVRNLRPSDSADAFSHRAVDGSVLEDNLSSNASSDGESYTGLQQNSSQEGETQGGNGSFHRVDDTEHTDNTPSHGPLTTPEFLQVALLEALGGDIPGAEEYFDDYSIEEVSPFEDIEMDGADDDISESDDTSTSEAVAYQVFNRMSRGAFPSDPSIYGQRESLIDFSSTPAPTHANFPILHFSQTDIRLIPNPLAPRATVFCGTPLRQQFTHIVGSLRDACDRFNMVKYIPEHGIVVAASQKGRAAVITLTESEANGPSFRVDWIVPFESQEKYGDRPLIPLLGMSVGPMQGFEMPPDVPNIPHDANGDGLKFHYEPTTNDELDASLQNSSKSSDILGEDLRPPYEACGTRVSRESTPTVSTQVDTIPEQEQQTFPTLPECHARATRAYQPEETWRGWNPSRRYRLLLLFADHTVLSYEFWYNWSPTGTADDESDEEGYLVV
ncbi:hypothetical protein ANOM_001374 [Aspergillus nomiae NRRL 13137]|uniref:Pyridine nucleotide-disulfide oxidoreductase family protein n=1 Tax=Aspergillus nomiae NRRL (strain ATCC 15546 / NRRL 13137 / CBS 260.88 / M93) TaxID=1509407 RepID=A0A0L1JEP3_ASPN3|nr:uncharacterized protein ANOM_001374 [Aspergillus nomiae NRRL 13137]KNG90137.1 hypothetical protein ANOM_001374 [Aspergillus nomiae NRRL 13137]